MAEDYYYILGMSGNIYQIYLFIYSIPEVFLIFSNPTHHNSSIQIFFKLFRSSSVQQMCQCKLHNFLNEVVILKKLTVIFIIYFVQYIQVLFTVLLHFVEYTDISCLANMQLELSNPIQLVGLYKMDSVKLQRPPSRTPSLLEPS